MTATSSSVNAPSLAREAMLIMTKLKVWLSRSAVVAIGLRLCLSVLGSWGSGTRLDDARGCNYVISIAWRRLIRSEANYLIAPFLAFVPASAWRVSSHPSRDYQPSPQISNSLRQVACTYSSTFLYRRYLSYVNALNRTLRQPDCDLRFH